MLLKLLIASLLIAAANAGADTQGTEFRVVFTRNFELDSKNCNLSITIVNPNVADVQVAINYYNTMYDYSSYQYEAVKVPKAGMLRQQFPQFDAWEYTNGGFQQQFDTRIVVTSSQPVTLYASNYLYSNDDEVGDTYLVLPYNMAGTSYAFTLPAPAPRTNDVIEYAIAYIIPTRKDVNVELTVGSWHEKRLIPFKIGSPVHYFAVPYTIGMTDPSFYITGDADFLVVAGVTCLLTANGRFDYAAFMPTPVFLPGKCQTTAPTTDNHPTDLVNSKKFSITPNLPSDCKSSVNFYDGQRSQEVLSSGQFIQTDKLFGDRVIIGATNMPTQPIRFGGLSIGGAFLTGVPSTKQFVSGTTYFHSEVYSMTMYIVTDALASLTMRLDGAVVPFSPEILLIDGNQYHFTMSPVYGTGVHKLEASPGNYIFYLIGELGNGHATGYYPAFNKAK